MKNYTKIASDNFIKAVEQVIEIKPLIKGNPVKNATEVCKLLNMNGSAMSEIKAGKRDVTLNQLITFCKIFNYDLNQMAGISKPGAGIRSKEIDMICERLQGLK